MADHGPLSDPQTPPLEHEVDDSWKSVATVAAAAMTSLTGLLTTVGLTTDRLAVIYTGKAVIPLRGALLAAVAATGLGLMAVLVKTKARTVLLALGVIALLASLVLGIMTAEASFSQGGRPNIVKVSVTADGDAHATLSFTVMAEGVKSDNLLRAIVLEVPDTPEVLPLYTTTLRPNNRGVVNQEVSVSVERKSSAQRIRLQVYWDTLATATPTPMASPASGIATPERIRPPDPVDDQCGTQASAEYAAACIEVVVVGTIASAPPTA